MVIRTGIGGHNWRKILRALTKCRRDAVVDFKLAVPASETVRSNLKLTALDLFDRGSTKRISLNFTLAMSPSIRQVARPRYTAKYPEPTQAVTATSAPGFRGVKVKATNTLVLPEDMSTVDIPPLLLGQVNEAAIDQLSDLLQRW